MNLINYAKTEFKAQFYTVLVKSSKFILKIFDFLFHLLDFAKTVLNWTFSFKNDLAGTLELPKETNS